MLLGAPSVSATASASAFDTRKALALLAHLALVDRPRSRDALGELLWPGHDAEHARGALRRTLSTLRAAVGERARRCGRERRRAGAAGRSARGRRRRVPRAARRGGPDTPQAAAARSAAASRGLRAARRAEFDDWQRRGGRRAAARAGRGAAARSSPREAAGGAYGGDRARAPLARARPAARAGAPRADPAHALDRRPRRRARAVPRLRAHAEPRARRRAAAGDRRALRAGQRRHADRARAPPAPAAGRPRSRRRPFTPLVGRDARLAALRRAYAVGRARRGGRGASRARPGSARRGWSRSSPRAGAAGPSCWRALLRGREPGWPTGRSSRRCAARLRGGAAWSTASRPRAGRRRRGWCASWPRRGRALPARRRARRPGRGGALPEAVWDVLAAARPATAPGVLFLDDVQWADEATLGLLAYGLRRLRAARCCVAAGAADAARAPAAARRGRGARAGRRRRRGGSSGSSEAERRASCAPASDADALGGCYLETRGRSRCSSSSTCARARRPAPGRAPGELLRARLDPAVARPRAAGARRRRGARPLVRRRHRARGQRPRRRGDRRGAGGARRPRARPRGRAPTTTSPTSSCARSSTRRRASRGGGCCTAARPTRSHGPEPASRRGAVTSRSPGRDAEAAEAHVARRRARRGAVRQRRGAGAPDAALALGDPTPPPLHARRGDLLTLLGDYAARCARPRHARPAERAALEHRLGRLHHRRGDLPLAERHLAAALRRRDDPGARAQLAGRPRASLADDGGDAATGPRSSPATRSRSPSAPTTPARAGARAQPPRRPRHARRRTREAVAHLERSRELAEQTGDDAGPRGGAEQPRARLRAAQGELGRALELTRAALELCVAQATATARRRCATTSPTSCTTRAGRDDAMRELKVAVTLFAEIGGDRPEVWKLARW